MHVARNSPLSVVAIASVVAVFVALACAGSASAAWTPIDVADNRGVFLPRVAVGARGDAVFTWGRHGPPGVGATGQARARSAAGVLGPSLDLSDPDTPSSPLVAVAANGAAVFTWTHRTFGVQARSLSPTGTLGPIVNLPAAGGRAHAPQVAVDAVGDAVFVWTQGDRVQTRSLSAAGHLGPIATLSAGGAAVHWAGVAATADGDALFVWDRSTRTHGRVQARARSARGRLGPLLTLSARGQRAIRPRLAATRAGHALATWTRSATPRGAVDARVQARVFSAIGKLGPILNVSGRLPAANADESASPHVNLLANGKAVFTWTRAAPPNSRQLMRTLSPAGRWGPTITLLTSRNVGGGEAAFGPGEVAFAPDGDGVLAWQQLEGRDYDGPAHIRVRSISATGKRGATVILSPPRGYVDLPRVAVAANGIAIVTWPGAAGIQGAAGP